MRAIENPISIHALVKRATGLFDEYIDKYAISIHALVKRATGGGTIPPPLIIISIHALVKRATGRIYDLRFF